MKRDRSASGGLGRDGFTLMELAVVLVLVSLGLAMALPRMATPPEKKAEWVALQIERDIELSRTRAQSTRKRVRVVFDVAGQRYASYLDDDRDGAFSEDADEMAAFLGGRWISVKDEILFGRGAASVPAPGDSGSGAVTFAAGKLNFSSRGIPMPLGTSGYIYVYHRNSKGAVAAIRVAPSGSTQVFVLTQGVWK